MSFARRLRLVRQDESGAITVDWVVLTAVVVVIASALVSMLAPNLKTASSYVSDVVVSAKDTSVD